MNTARLDLSGGEIEYQLIPAPPGRHHLPVLVFLHEGLGSLALWRGFPEEVAASTGRGALVWSRHGYGHSGGVSQPRRRDYMHREALEVLPELLERLAITHPVLVGHSDGGSIALIYAGSASDGLRPSAVVALAPHVMVEDISVSGIEDARRRYVTTDLPVRMGRYHADADATFWGWNRVWLSPEFRSWNIEEYLPQVTCPVLAIQSRDDPYGTLAQLDRIEAGVRGPFRRLVLADGGHSCHLTHPARVRDAVTGFVDAPRGSARRW